MRKVVAPILGLLAVASACASPAAPIARRADAPLPPTTRSRPPTASPTTTDAPCVADPDLCDPAELGGATATVTTTTTTTPTTATPPTTTTTPLAPAPPKPAEARTQSPPVLDGGDTDPTDGEIVACDADGDWPAGAADPGILVRWTGTDWEFVGRPRLASAATRVAFEYHRGSPAGVYIALVGLTDGKTLADFLDVARDQELGRYHVRRGDGGSRWDVPDWVSFVGSVEHGCVVTPGAAHRALRSYYLPAGRYVVLGHSSWAAGVGSLAAADIVAEFDVVRLRVAADGSSIRFTECHDPRCLDQTQAHIRAESDCADRVEVALGPDGRPRLAYITQPDGDPLCESDMEQWVGSVQLIECLDTACAEYTERTLADVDYLWSGPYRLDVHEDGTIATSWYVAATGHPVSDVTLVSAVCDHDACDLTDLGSFRPWDITY